MLVFSNCESFLGEFVFEGEDFLQCNTLSTKIVSRDGKIDFAVSSKAVAILACGVSNLWDNDLQK